MRHLLGAGPSLLLLCRPAVMLPPFSTLTATSFQLSDKNVHQALLAAVHEVTFERRQGGIMNTVTFGSITSVCM